MSPDAAAAAVGLCAALCGEPGSTTPGAKRALDVLLSGDALQVASQAAQSSFANGSANPDVLQASAQLGACLAHAVLEEDSGSAATAASVRMQTVLAMAKRAVVAALSSPAFTNSAACMEATLQLVVTACTYVFLALIP